jgi:hypothetical protein
MKISADIKKVHLITTFAALDPNSPEGVVLLSEFKETKGQVANSKDDWEDGVVGGGLIVTESIDHNDLGNVDRNPDGSIKFEPGLDEKKVALLGTYSRDQLLSILLQMSDDFIVPMQGENA